MLEILIGAAEIILFFSFESAAGAGALAMEMRLWNGGCTMGRTRMSSVKKSGIHLLSVVVFGGIWMSGWILLLTAILAMLEATIG